MLFSMRVVVERLVLQVAGQEHRGAALGTNEFGDLVGLLLLVGRGS